MHVFHREGSYRPPPRLDRVKLSKSTPSVRIYGETGTTPLHITIEKRMIGCWLQIIMGSSSKLNYQIYKYVLHLICKIYTLLNGYEK